MTMEIHNPELERRVREALDRGRFHDFAEMLTKALAALPDGRPAAGQRETRTGTALVEAMQASPYKEIELGPKRYRLPVRDVDL
jgi:Arc/MetJ-type ribon-helix-helix transcriptional regulator